MILKNFIVFEGIDGAGTSTQIELLKESEFSGKFFFTAEPTDAPTGKFLREMLKGGITLDPRTSSFLFAADRSEHLWGNSGGKCGIEQKCKDGKIVVSDRYLFSSLAYQSVACGEEIPRLLNSFFPLPQILFFFKIEPEISLARITGRETKEIYENVEFLKKTERLYEKVIAEYEAKTAQEIAQGAKETMKIVRIDATQSKDEIAKFILETILTNCQP